VIRRYHHRSMQLSLFIEAMIYFSCAIYDRNWLFLCILFSVSSHTTSLSMKNGDFSAWKIGICAIVTPVVALLSSRLSEVIENFKNHSVSKFILVTTILQVLRSWHQIQVYVLQYFFDYSSIMKPGGSKGEEERVS
jgi:hypothetical protein